MFGLSSIGYFFRGLYYEYQLVLQNGVYQVEIDGKRIQVIPKNDNESYHAYKVRAKMEFEFMIQDANQQLIDRKVIKEAYVAKPNPNDK